MLISLFLIFHVSGSIANFQPFPHCFFFPYLKMFLGDFILLCGLLGALAQLLLARALTK